MKKNEVISIKTLAKEFESYSELQAYCDAQYQIVKNLTADNTAYRAEIVHLKELLATTTQLVGQPVQKVEVTPEQAICEVQIQKLQEKAFAREMSLEETKRLEILIKSLYLIKEKTGETMNAEFTQLPAGSTLESLAAIAASPEAQPESD